MIRTRGRRPLACHHEAGHAVARWWLGFHTDDAAVLSADEVRAGVTLPDRRGRPQRCEGIVNGYNIHLTFAREQMDGTWDDATRRRSFGRQAEQRTDMALVELYAGAYAEARYLRRSSLACFLSGGDGDLAAAREIAAAWHGTEEGCDAAHRRGETIAKALVRSPKGWAAIQAMADALHERGKVNGLEINALCSAAYGAPFKHDRWSECWPPTPAQIRAGFLPVREPRRAA